MADIEKASVLQFPAIRPKPTYDERQAALAEQLTEEIRAVIAKYCPDYYTPEGQADVREALATRRAEGKLTW